MTLLARCTPIRFRIRLGRPGRLYCFLGLISVAIATPGCGDPQLQAQWRDREIAIDGDFHDWDGKLFHFEEQDIYAGVMEDETNLYVCFSTSDRTRMWQVVRGGLTLWFDPSNEEKRTFGLRFPVGGASTPPNGPPPDSLLKSPPDGAESGPPRDKRGPAGDFKEKINSGDIRKAIAKFTTEDRQIEIQHEGSVPARLFLAEANGLDVQVGFSDDVFTYELKIPKQAKPEYPYSIATIPGKSMTIGLETAVRAKGDRGSRRGSEGAGPGSGGPEGGEGRGNGHGGHGRGGPPMGGRGPGGGGPPGEMSGGGLGRGGERPTESPLKVWIRVKPLETEEK